jgi:UDP-glucuronate 4-epimerase
VYGANSVLPSGEDYVTDHPLSFYAATKKANEAMAHSYAHLFGLPMTGVRFFTVYGPWGRPDMAFFKFTDAIVSGRQIDVYNNGKMSRDFTYIDDVTECLIRLIEHPPTTTKNAGKSQPISAQSPVAPYRIYNLGNGSPVALMRCIETLEKCIGRKANINYLPIQPGEVEDTSANIDGLSSLIGYRPKTGIETGIPKFFDWYKTYYNPQ